VIAMDKVSRWRRSPVWGEGLVIFILLMPVMIVVSVIACLLGLLIL
jgi:hypothetical protein